MLHTLHIPNVVEQQAGRLTPPRPASCHPQLPTNEPWAHWAASHYNASLVPGNDCVLGMGNDKYDYFTGNSTSTTGGPGTDAASGVLATERRLPCHEHRQQLHAVHCSGQLA
jgi:hypothetical protein